MSMITYWLITWSLSHQLHVVEYDNLIDNKSGEISKMLRFMGIHVEEENVRDKLGDGFRYITISHAKLNFSDDV